VPPTDAEIAIRRKLRRTPHRNVRTRSTDDNHPFDVSSRAAFSCTSPAGRHAGADSVDGIYRAARTK
jgi:hypothetical protein